MAVRFARWVWQEGVFIGALLYFIALYGYRIMPGGFDLTALAAGASTCLFLVTARAVRARHPIAITISLVLLVAAMGACSVGFLGHTGVSLSAAGDLASVWLATVISLVLLWRFTRRRPPPSEAPPP